MFTYLNNLKKLGRSFRDKKANSFKLNTTLLTILIILVFILLYLALNTHGICRLSLQ